MSLESLLKPIRWADEQILRYYTKKAEAWEEQGRSKYSLAQICNVAAACANIFYVAVLGNYAGLPLLGLQSSEFARNIKESKYKQDQTAGAITALPASLKTAQTIAAYARLPLFASGAALLIKGIIDMMTFAATKETGPLAGALENLSLGYAMLGTASSMYIKESDPKLLEKKPFEELAYHRQLQPARSRK